MRRMVNAFRAWVPFAVAVTALCALVYGAVQQSLRQGANDPQIQMAEDAAAALNGGAKLDAVLPREQVDISGSLAPFVVVYDMEGKAVAGSGILNGKLPDFPKGALEAARQSGENRVTWQPDTGIRIASVVAPYKDGYVMAGRSLREVEKRETQSETYAGLTWLATLPAIFAAIAVFGSGWDRAMPLQSHVQQKRPALRARRALRLGGPSQSTEWRILCASRMQIGWRCA